MFNVTRGIELYAHLPSKYRYIISIGFGILVWALFRYWIYKSNQTYKRMIEESKKKKVYGNWREQFEAKHKDANLN